MSAAGSREPHYDMRTHPDLGLLILRVWFGGVFAFAHGLPKLQQLLGGDYGFPDPLGLGSGLSLGLAVFGELICGLLIASGLFARLAALPAIFTMAIAAFVTYGADPFEQKELALLYLVAFVVVMVAGPGRYSVDALRHRG